MSEYTIKKGQEGEVSETTILETVVERTVETSIARLKRGADSHMKELEAQLVRTNDAINALETAQTEIGVSTAEAPNKKQLVDLE